MGDAEIKVLHLYHGAESTSAQKTTAIECTPSREAIIPPRDQVTMVIYAMQVERGICRFARTTATYTIHGSP